LEPPHYQKKFEALANAGRRNEPGDFVWMGHHPSRLLMNHSLLPLSCLPRKRAGEKIAKEPIFSQGVESQAQGSK
jgi:hypothetical protein